MLQPDSLVATLYAAFIVTLADARKAGGGWTAPSSCRWSVLL
jgi:hypothetical protein